MNLQELIDFHTVGAEACEAYAVTPGAAEDKNKDIGKHYNKRAKWHRDAIALVQNMAGALELVTNAGFELEFGNVTWGSLQITVEDWNLIKAASPGSTS